MLKSLGLQFFAFEKTITDDFGQVTAYHKIQSVTQNYIATPNVIDINVASYANAEYRELDKIQTCIAVTLPIKAPEQTVIAEDDTVTVIPPAANEFARETLYTRIKNEDARFADAEDC